MNIFDSLFAETNEFYLKRKDMDAKTMGWLLVSLVQYLVLLNFAIGYTVVSQSTLSRIVSFKIAVPIIAFIGLLNFLRYNKRERFQTINKEWEMKSKGTKNAFKILSVLAILLLIGLPIVYGVITNGS